MVINGSCSTNMYARQLSFNFSSMVWGGGMAPWPPFGSAPDGNNGNVIVCLKGIFILTGSHCPLLFACLYCRASFLMDHVRRTIREIIGVTM